MTSQLLMSTGSSTLTREIALSEAVPLGRSATASSDHNHRVQLMKSLYQADQQVKLLHLEAEIDSLLLQLQQALKHQSSLVPATPQKCPDHSHN